MWRGRARLYTQTCCFHAQLFLYWSLGVLFPTYHKIHTQTTVMHLNHHLSPAPFTSLIDGSHDLPFSSRSPENLAALSQMVLQTRWPSAQRLCARPQWAPESLSSLIPVLPDLYCWPLKGQNQQGEQGPTFNLDSLLHHQAALAPIPPGHKEDQKKTGGKKGGTRLTPMDGKLQIQPRPTDGQLLVGILTIFSRA